MTRKVLLVALVILIVGMNVLLHTWTSTSKPELSPVRVADVTAVFQDEKWPKIPFPGEFYDLLAFDIDSRGRIWAGFEDWFHQTIELAMFEVVNGEYKYHYVPGSWGAKITDIEIDDADRVWVATLNSGFFILDGDDRKIFTKYNSDLPSDRVRSIAFDKAGRAWIATELGISGFDGESWLNYVEESLGIAPLDVVSDVVVDGVNRVWVLYNESGVRVLDGKQWGYVDLSVRSIKVDIDGNVWLYSGPFAYKEPKPASLFMTRMQFIISSGVPTYLSVLLIGIWVMILIGTEKNIKWSLVGFVVYLVWVFISVPFSMLLGSARLEEYSPFFLWLNPGTYGTIGSMIGSISGKYFPHNSDQRQETWARNGLLIGLFGSFCAMANELFTRAVSGVP